MVAPGLRGFLAGQQMNQAEDAANMQKVQGVLGLQGALMQQQMMPLQLAQLQGAIADAEQKRKAQQWFLGQLQGGDTGGVSPIARDASGNVIEGGMSAPGSGAPSVPAFLTNPTAVAAAKALGVGDFTDLYKHVTSPQQYQQGSMYQDRVTGVFRQFPRLPEGATQNPDGSVGLAPGFVQAATTLAGIPEQAKAGFDVIKVPDGSGGQIDMTRADWANMVRQGVPPQALAGRPPAEVSAIAQVAGSRNPMSVTVPNPTGGRMGYTPPASVSAGNTAVSEARAKDAVEREVRFRNQYGEAYDQIQRLDLMEQLFKDPNVAAGRLAEEISGLKGFAESFGIKTEGKSAETVLGAIAGELALKNKNQGGQNLMPGAVSNFEQQLLKSMVPSLAQDRVGRQLLVQVFKAKAERDMKISEMAAEYIDKNGKLDNGFDRQVREYSKNNPMFAQDRILAMIETAKRLSGGR